MNRSRTIFTALVAISMWVATSADAAICSRNGTLFLRDVCRPNEVQTSDVSICAAGSGKLSVRSACKASEGLALEGDGSLCANRSGKVMQRAECRSSEHEIGRPSLCASRSGKIGLAESCGERDSFLGAVALHRLSPSSYNTGSGGTLSFTCSGGICECHGTEDCNDMFGTTVCDGAIVSCCDANYPETCRCGDVDWCASRASALPTVAHETADHFFPKPKYGSYRLDWCESWATNCGRPAADRFCRRHYGSEAEAIGFSLDAHIGHVTPTLTQVDRKLCDQSFCGGFESITCRAPATAFYRPDGIVSPAPIIH